MTTPVVSNENDKPDPAQPGAEGPYTLSSPLHASRLEQRAVKQRWPVKDEYKEAVVKRMAMLVADPQSKPRTQVAAARVIVAAENQNMQDEHKQKPDLVEHSHAVQVYLPHNGRDDRPDAIGPPLFDLPQAQHPEPLSDEEEDTAPHAANNGDGDNAGANRDTPSTNRDTPSTNGNGRI